MLFTQNYDKFTPNAAKMTNIDIYSKELAFMNQVTNKGTFWCCLDLSYIYYIEEKKTFTIGY